MDQRSTSSRRVCIDNQLATDFQLIYVYPDWTWMETRLDHRNFPFIRGEEDNSISPAVSFDPSLNSTNRPRFLASPRMDGKPRFPPTRDYRFIVKLVPNAARAFRHENRQKRFLAKSFGRSYSSFNPSIFKVSRIIQSVSFL